MESLLYKLRIARTTAFVKHALHISPSIKIARLPHLGKPRYFAAVGAPQRHDAIHENGGMHRHYVFCLITKGGVIAHDNCAAARQARVQRRAAVRAIDGFPRALGARGAGKDSFTEG